MAAIASGLTRVCSRAMGFNANLPEAPLPPLPKLSGAWTVTSGCFCGTVIFVLQCGQPPVLPANLSSTLNFFLQPGQETWIEFAGLESAGDGVFFDGKAGKGQKAIEPVG